MFDVFLDDDEYNEAYQLEKDRLDALGVDWFSCHECGIPTHPDSEECLCVFCEEEWESL